MKIKTVKTTITETQGTALVFDGKDVTKAPFTLKASFKTEDGLQNALRKYFTTLNLSFVKVEYASRVKVTYGVDIDWFLLNAKILTEETGLSVFDEE